MREAAAEVAGELLWHLAGRLQQLVLVVIAMLDL